MAIKKLQNNFTTPEQSKRLLELGVPANSADCYLLRTITKEDTFIVDVLHDELYSKKDKFTNILEYLPCWSVGRLIEISLICGIGDKVPNALYINKYSLVDSLVGNIISRLEKVADLSVNDIDFSKLEE